MVIAQLRPWEVLVVCSDPGAGALSESKEGMDDNLTYHRMVQNPETSSSREYNEKRGEQKSNEGGERQVIVCFKRFG